MSKNETVSWKYLIIPVLLALFTTMLSVIAVFNPNNFYTTMNMSVPDDNFMTLSWAARNTAIAIALWIVILFFRTPQTLLVALSARFTMDILDLLVDFQTNTPPAFMVWIIIGSEILMFVLLFRLMTNRKVEKI